MKARLVISIVCLLLSACSHYTLLEPHRYQVTEFYSVEPQISWSRAKQGTVELWTVDGPLLQAVRLISDIKEGDVLFPVFGQDKKLPQFRAGMTATEIQELVVDSMAASGAANISTSNLRPFQFGTLPGFRFELQFLSADGLEFDGTAAGTTSEGRLFLILYTGTRSHYFDKHKPDVERMLQSIQTSA